MGELREREGGREGREGNREKGAWREGGEGAWGRRERERKKEGVREGEGEGGREGGRDGRKKGRGMMERVE